MKRAVFSLGLILSVVVGALFVLGGNGGAERGIRQIKPLPDGLDPITYRNAVRIVETARPFVETRRQVQSFRTDLEEQRQLVTRKDWEKR